MDRHEILHGTTGLEMVLYRWKKELKKRGYDPDQEYVLATKFLKRIEARVNKHEEG